MGGDPESLAMAFPRGPTPRVPLKYCDLGVSSARPSLQSRRVPRVP